MNPRGTINKKVAENMESITLISPPAAKTESSIALIWNKPESATDIACYQIYLNESLCGITNRTDYTVTDLLNANEYEACVHAMSKEGTILCKSNTIRELTKPKSEIFNIENFGALGDGITVNTKAIQAAIDACTQGGMVYVPKGSFLTGALFLKSNMTLYIEKESALLGSANPAEYPLMSYRWQGAEALCYASLINTLDEGDKSLENITIEGGGVVDANGAKLLSAEEAENKGERGRAICIRNTNNFYLSGITVRNSPAWCVHLIYCVNASINQVQIHTKYDEYGKQYQGIHNGDGLNPDSCKNVYIFHCTISSQDDCIAIKSGRDEEGRNVGVPSQNIHIVNCVFKSGFGIAIGSEMSGGVKNVTVSNCVFDDVFSIATIKTPRGRGACIDGITYSDCILKNDNPDYTDCRWFRGAINIDQFYGCDEFDLVCKETVDDGTPVIKNITFRNIILDTRAGNAVYMAGLPESPLINIRIDNLQAIGKYGMKAFNINGLVLKDSYIYACEGESTYMRNIDNFKQL